MCLSHVRDVFSNFISTFLLVLFVKFRHLHPAVNLEMLLFLSEILYCFSTFSKFQAFFLAKFQDLAGQPAAGGGSGTNLGVTNERC